MLKLIFNQIWLNAKKHLSCTTWRGAKERVRPTDGKNGAGFWWWARLKEINEIIFIKTVCSSREGLL